MEAKEAAELVAAMAAALESNPQQFVIQMKTMGAQFQGSNGGTGANITTIGGAAGSIASGVKITAIAGTNSSNLQAIKGVADPQINKLIADLKSVSDELRKTSPDKGRIAAFLDAVRNTWVPTVITAVISTAIGHVTGLNG